MLRKNITILAAIMLILFPVFTVYADDAQAIDFPLEKNDAGANVLIIQNRLKQLGFLHFSPTGKYGDMTVSAVKAFQRRNGLSVTGIADQNTVLTMFSENCIRTANTSIVPVIYGKRQIASVEHGELHDWVKTVSNAFKVGDTATLIDYNTGVEITVQRTGGNNHADVTPLNPAALVDLFGGGSTWDKRACIIQIDGMRIAASLFGYPNANGEYCLYFSGSTSDVNGLPDAEHQEMLKKANGQ